MEKPKASPKKLKTSLCIPRLKGNGCTNKNKGLSPLTTLLERFREAVFRLIMLSAMSKATNHTESADVQRCHYPINDPHHSEAVADCIEFIKKKASTDENRDSTASSSSSIHTSPDVILPVPVT
jgi:hypothetical protein|uniref:Uncharacterized protein n=1 Tax=Fagus sylvatica TaxID=28930 RepID=A0A2N9H458_FAGSY